MCEDIKVIAEDGSCLICRSMQFAWAFQFSFRIRERGGSPYYVPLRGKKCFKIDIKYGYGYVDSGEKYDFCLDGLNEKGLGFAFLNMKLLNNKFQGCPEGEEHLCLPIFLLGDFILGSFKNIEEVVQGLLNNKDRPKFVSQGVAKEQVFMCQPFQAAVHDASGKSIAIQFFDGKMQIFQNKVGVLTNAPDYKWQETNLGHYCHLTPYVDYTIRKIGGVPMKAFGQGQGLKGLPGDTLPSSRFVKAAIFRKFGLQPKNAQQGIIFCQHLLNSFDLPKGVNRTFDTDGSQLINYTKWQIIKDLTNLRAYFKTYQNRTLRMIDLKRVDFSVPKKIKLVQEPYHAEDISHLFQ